MAPVLHLAGNGGVTKAEAQQILDLWGQRTKARPTKREQALYALARAVIPEVKRPVGRPRKAR